MANQSTHLIFNHFIPHFAPSLEISSINSFQFFFWYLLFEHKRIPDGKSPRFPKKPTIRQDEDNLIMECVIEAHPVPDIAWYQGEKSVVGSNRIKMSRKAISKDSYILTLEISNPTREDGGNYRCNAFNLYGESNANIALNFQGTECVRDESISWLTCALFAIAFTLEYWQFELFPFH